MDDPRPAAAQPDSAAKDPKAGHGAGEEFEVADAIAPLRIHPSSEAELSTQALKGERVTVFERNGEGWARARLNNDGYAGWLPDRALVKPTAPPTHKVAALRTLAFPGPSIKLPPVEALPMGAVVTVVREEDIFAVTREGWYLPRRHLHGLDHRAADFVSVAEQFLGTPYLWGGKSSLGIDCSGLVQVALNAAGVACPRDSDMQQTSLGRTLTAAEAGEPRRGDLIFWKGHVAIVRDPASILHANAHHMATAVENTGEAIARTRTAGIAVTAIKRLA